MSPDSIKKEIPGNLSSRRASCAAALLSVTAFWGGMLMAARRYPAEYDWRYMPVSDLVSSGDNPAGYLWASAGIVLSGLCGLWWASALRRLGNHGGAAGLRRGIPALWFGNICLIAAVLPRRLVRLHKGHEILATLAFAGLCIGVVCLMFHVVERTLLMRTQGSGDHARLSAAVAAGAAVCPILLAGLTQAYVHYVLPELPWVNLSWRARGVPVYLSFAFWEWSTCVVLSAYIAVLSLAAPAVSPASMPRIGKERGP